jgi:Fe-S oxidoreductase
VLTPGEKALFLLTALAAAVFAVRKIGQFRRVIRRGGGTFKLDRLPRRLWEAATIFVTQRTVLKRRLPVSLLHVMLAWAFTYYVVLVNLGDTLHGLIPDFEFLGAGAAGNTHRLLADVVSVAALAGMTGLLARRFALRAPELDTRDRVLLYPGVRAGIRLDSLIVGLLTIGHVGGRFLENSFRLARAGAESWQPFAGGLASAWAGLSPPTLTALEHLGFWLAFGTAFAFVFYFPRSKHLHLFFAPLNYLLAPERRSIGQMESIDLGDEEIEQFGARRLEHLHWSRILDAYACIMCNRCQDACPAYDTGKVLSPAALEINKRYFINHNLAVLAAGGETEQALVEYAISSEAVWACTTCGACAEACPVGNNPMQDILDIRRDLVLMESDFPEQLQVAFRGMERAGNPWSVAGATRLDWAAGLSVPTIDANPDAELLWWVGCAPATDPRAQKTARAFARLLDAAGVSYAVLGQRERCTGDAARRAGNEAVFYDLAHANVATLNEVMAGKPRPIVTTCPHCLHTLKNEYPDFGGHYEVIHHSQLLVELLDLDRIPLISRAGGRLTYHDPCYLGRHNGIFDAPRRLLAPAELVELGRRRQNSFCCGAGGAQMWKEEEEGFRRVSQERISEAQATGADTLVVGCPFCMIMLSDANAALPQPLQLHDLADYLAAQLPSDSPG